MTFVSVGQFSVFSTCFAFGLAIGAAKSFFPARGKLQAVWDFLFFVAVFPAFAALSFFCRFPDFRPYMALVVFLGFGVMRKFLWELVAKPLTKWYNQRKSKRRAAILREKT